MIVRMVTALLGVLLTLANCPVAWAYDTVSFNSGGKVLHGLMYKPAGPGPFPAVLYNHGSAPGLLNNQAFDLIGPMFATRGWAFFAPYRRGQGLSSDAGPYIVDEIQAARARGGEPLAAKTMVRLLSTQQLEDQMAALAWLQRQAFVRPAQIAVMGNSFGGIEDAAATARRSLPQVAPRAGTRLPVYVASCGGRSRTVTALFTAARASGLKMSLGFWKQTVSRNCPAVAPARSPGAS